MRHVEVTAKYTGYIIREYTEGVYLHEADDGPTGRWFDNDTIVEVKDVENPLPSWWPPQEGDMLIEHIGDSHHAGVVDLAGKVTWSTGHSEFANGLLVEDSARRGRMEMVRRAGNL